MDPKKVDAVLHWPIPKSIKALRGFLGLTGYYRKFVKDYGKIAKPLTDLLKKGAFNWSAAATESFNALKDALTHSPVLTLPDFKEPFSIECDACGTGIRAVLTQGKRPVAYFSKGLATSVLSKSVCEKELMALVLAIQHWRPYLLGRRFTVFTDQKSLKYLLEQRITTPNQQNWMAKLLGYDFDIVYKMGATNKAADALSRWHEEKELRVLSRPFWQDTQQIDVEVQADPVLKKIIEELQQDPDSPFLHYRKW